jgi:hypothetical protein
LAGESKRKTGQEKIRAEGGRQNSFQRRQEKREMDNDSGNISNQVYSTISALYLVLFSFLGRQGRVFLKLWNRHGHK